MTNLRVLGPQHFSHLNQHDHISDDMEWKAPILKSVAQKQYIKNDQRKLPIHMGRMPQTTHSWLKDLPTSCLFKLNALLQQQQNTWR